MERFSRELAIEKIKIKIKDLIGEINLPNLKISLISTFIFGLLAHAYCFLNENFSHDSITAMYSKEDTWQYSIGRIFRSFYQTIKGGWELPWINGVLSLLFMTLAFYFINEILKIRKKPLIILNCAVLATSSSITLMNATYLQDSDSYMFALLCSVFGLWLSKVKKEYIPITIIFYVLSLGLYQTYIQVVIYLLLINFIKNLIEGDDALKITKRLILDLIIAMISMILYYVLYRVILNIKNIAPSMSSSSTNQFMQILNVNELINRFKLLIKSEWQWLTIPCGINKKIKIAINFLIVAYILSTIVLTSIKNRISSSSFLLTLSTLLLIPLAINFVTFLSGDYHDLTIFPLIITYSFSLSLVEEWQIINVYYVINKRLLIVILAIFVYDNVIYANQVYLKKELVSQNTLSTVTRLINRIEEMDCYVAGETEVAIIGELTNSPLNTGRANMPNDGVGIYYNFSATYNLRNYINDYLGCRMLLLDESKCEEIAKSPDVIGMEAFPSKYSIQEVNGVVVVKLSYD